MIASDWLTLLGDVLTGVYVAFTLWLVIITRKSLALTREQVNEAKIQSQQDREANDRQSQAALEASDIQSQSAIDAVREQIRASEQQAQEALYNQYRPVIVPLDTSSHSSPNFSEILLGNKGPGVALNTWGFLAIRNNPQKQHLLQTYFLAPGREMTVYLGDTGVQYPRSEFEGYNVHPLDGADGLPVRARLIVTYNDVFEKKYLSIFDLTNELGWQHVKLQKVDKRLDELVIMKKPSIAP
jgi:hypothetical protein